MPGIEYLYEEQDIMSQALKIDASSICAFCSRMKRGRLYAAARRHGYNVLALGQHLDDISESFLMSIFHNGRLRTMKEMITIYINRLKRAKAINLWLCGHFSVLEAKVLYNYVCPTVPMWGNVIFFAFLVLIPCNDEHPV